MEPPEDFPTLAMIKLGPRPSSAECGRLRPFERGMHCPHPSRSTKLAMETMERIVEELAVIAVDVAHDLPLHLYCNMKFSKREFCGECDAAAERHFN